MIFLAIFMKYHCKKCTSLCPEFNFHRNYSPEDYIEGNPYSKIWIVGINPKKEGKDYRTKKELRNYFSSNDVHPYFNDFKKVSKKLYELLMKKDKVAHIDIIKCSTTSFPPKGIGKNLKKVISNCLVYIKKQIEIYHPRLIICNGTPASKVVKSIIPPSYKTSDKKTSYFNSNKGIEVILSGFIGRIDDYSKIRLGKEVDYYITKLKL